MMGHTAARGYPDTRAHGEPGNLGSLVPGYLGTGTGVLLESPVWGTLVVGTRAGSLVPGPLLASDTVHIHEFCTVNT